MAHRAEGSNTKKRGRVAVFILLAVVVLLAGGAAAFYFLGGLELLPPLGPAAVPFVVEGEVRALALAAAPEDQSAAGFRAYFREAAESAAASGMNTLIYSGKEGLGVYWRDATFPYAGSSADKEKVDPLAILCEEAEAQGLQVYVAVDIYNATGYLEGMKGTAAKYAAEQGGEALAAFAAGDAAYAKLLVHSLSRLPHSYPVAGVVLTGLSPTEQNPATDATAFNEHLSEAVRAITALWRERGYTTKLALAFGEDTLLSRAAATTLAGAEQVQYLLPAFGASHGLAQRLASWGQVAPIIPAAPAGTEGERVLFTAAATPGYAGALLTSCTDAQTDPARLGVLASALERVDATLPVGFSIAGSLSVNYPANGAKVYTEGLFIMGNSNPNIPLTMNGAEVAGRASGGAFGIAVTLAYGENTFTFSQGDETATLTVTRPEPTGGGSGTATTPHDATKEAEPGQVIQVVSQIASALTDPHDDGSINETLPKGATAVVVDSVETTRYNASFGSNTVTWAYKIASGDYVLARNCTWVSGDGTTNFTDVVVEATPEGEILHFMGTGTPAAYISFDESEKTLILHFYNTSVHLPEGLSSQFITHGSVQPSDDGATAVHLATNGIWGYEIRYENGETSLFLKRAPTRSANPTKPLEGVRVLLDPGHGGDDAGALGLMGAAHGPNEKDLNLALAQTIAYRLRQLGAEVSMTRTDDTFISLEDRLAMQSAQTPDFFLSVHHNSAELTQDLNGIAGTQVYYFHPYGTAPSKPFAQNLISAVAPATGRAGGDARWSYFYVTRTTVCPSVLFEYGFVINPAEFESVSSTDGIYAAACATADALLATVPVAQ